MRPSWTGNSIYALLKSLYHAVGISSSGLLKSVVSHRFIFIDKGALCISFKQMDVACLCVDNLTGHGELTLPMRVHCCIAICRVNEKMTCLSVGPWKRMDSRSVGHFCPYPHFLTLFWVSVTSYTLCGISILSLGGRLQMASLLSNLGGGSKSPASPSGLNQILRSATICDYQQSQEELKIGKPVEDNQLSSLLFHLWSILFLFMCLMWGSCSLT